MLRYDSEKYALLNTPIETDRHVARVIRYLDPQADDRVLEVGCGRGFLTRRIQLLAPHTCGIDINPQCIVHAVAPALRVMDAIDLQFEDEQFDKVYSFHAIEHIERADLAMREIHRVLAPGGRALLVYPAEPIRGLYAMPGAWLGFGNPLKARELHVHRFTPRKLAAVAEANCLVHVSSAFSLFITPQFLTLVARAPVARRAPRAKRRTVAGAAAQ
ncbi:MAG: methyltransferase domain-containing protein [Gemmatimonadaceae bacterium]